MANLNRKLLHLARAETERRRSSTPLNANPLDVLQEVLDGALADLRFAQDRVDGLDDEEVFRPTPQGVLPNEWIRLRDDYRQELERIANNLVRAGIAERSVRVKEAEAALLIHAVRAAALEIGMPNEQVRALGAALRGHMERVPMVRDAAADVAQLHGGPEVLPS